MPPRAQLPPVTPMPRVLVAYSSKTRSTAEIAEAIADEIRRSGIEAVAADVHERPDARDFDAVVLGSALYIFRWRRGARAFARRNARALLERPLWMFSSGPFDRSAEEGEVPMVKGARRIFERLHARGHKTFGGRAGSPRIQAALEKDGKPIDYRNFEQIRGWARGIAGDLRAPAGDTKRQEAAA